MSETTEKAAEQEAPPPEPQADPDIERQARLMGWKPKEEFRGKEWRPADEFMRRGWEELPVLRENHRRLLDRVEGLLRDNAEGKQVLQELDQRSRKAEERGYRRAKSELEQKRTAAVESGDTNAFKAVDQELQELEKTAPKPTTQQQPPAAAQPAQPTQPAPEVAAWGRENVWYTDRDPRHAEAVAYADAMHIYLMRAKPNLLLGENLNQVTKEVKSRFPHLFPGEGDNERRAEPSAVTGSSAQPSGGGRQRADARSFAAMPKESKDAYHRYKRQLEGKGTPLTEKDWADDYWAQFREGP